MEKAKKTPKDKTKKRTSRAELLRRKRESSAANRVSHPFLCRLEETESISVSSPQSLVGAGFASLSLAMFTFFRPTPGLLIMFTRPMDPNWDYSVFSRDLMWTAMGCWMTVIYIVLLFFGLILLCSVLVKKRSVLMLHPWGLMLLYVDVFFWVGMIIFLHLRTITWPEDCPKFTEKTPPTIYYVIMYIECALFGALYYFYATFFIAAELTIIERHFP